MHEFLSSVSTKGQVTLPVQIRRQLGLKPRDKLIVLVEGGDVVMRPAHAGLRAGFQSIPALDRVVDLEAMTEIAAEEHAEEAAYEGDVTA